MRRAFTLIELLVVISVLVLLISMLLPVMGRAVDASRESACNSLINNLSTAIHNYAGDDNDCIPKAATAFYPLMVNGQAQLDPEYGNWEPINNMQDLSWQTVLAIGNYVATQGPFYGSADAVQDQGVPLPDRPAAGGPHAALGRGSGGGHVVGLLHADLFLQLRGAAAGMGQEPAL